MWYFAWILGVLLACSFGIINVMWLESESVVNDDENRT
jgi:cytochrome bd-I ubiquinol oxidase subunit X